MRILFWLLAGMVAAPAAAQQTPAPSIDVAMDQLDSNIGRQEAIVEPQERAARLNSRPTDEALRKAPAPVDRSKRRKSAPR